MNINQLKLKDITRGEKIIKEAELCASANTQLIGDWGEHYLGFIHGAEWADAHPHWISVEDDLPKFGKDVLVLRKDGEMQVAHQYNEEIARWWSVDGYPLNYNITHWMPMPQAPKKGGTQ